ncbi:hypothetical protein ACFCXF_20855 [Streptomyces virginiae]|uniref:hypothetical protein n=1 Tax=Streptomyces virginiae TaxID=1961 RepID=UPI0035DA5B17
MMITKRSAVAPASTARRRRLFVAWVISFAAVGIGVFHTFMPDVKIDGITLVLAAIAVVPWLGDLFESIELPGGTKLQYLQQRMDETEQFTQEVRHAADDAARQARVALVTSGSENIAGDSPAEKVAELTHAFTELRRTEPSSPGRTYRQEQIFAELVRPIHAVGAVVDAIGPGHVDVATVRRLRRGFSEVPEDSDRARTLRGVLARLDHDAA